MKKNFYNINNYYNNISQNFDISSPSCNINKIIAYIFYKKNIFNYNYESNIFRNDFLYNFNHNRYYNKNIKHSFDPLIYEQKNTTWPDYVTRIYYTNLTYSNEIVQLSYINNLFINMCFKNNDYVPLYRIGFYAIYELLSSFYETKNYILHDPNEILYEKILKYFMIKNKVMKNYENVDFFFKDHYINNYNKKKYNLISSKKNELLTTWAYKNFYDYVPVCYVLPNYNPRFMLMSNICYHDNNCHDSLCHTHNKIYANNSHPHYDYQYTYKFNELQIINILSLS